MREVSDGLDLAVTVVMFVMMMSICAFSIVSIRNSSYLVVEERTSVSNEFGYEVEQPPVRTAEDALMMLVVNDAYAPFPATAVFSTTGANSQTTTVTFDNDFFGNKNTNLNTQWTRFFSGMMDKEIDSIELRTNPASWFITLK